MTRGVERKGKRAKRGLFVTSEGRYVNSDINGAIGIMRKAKGISDAQLLSLRDRGDIVSPRVLKFNP